MDSSPPSEINYTERVLAQNSMDVEFDDIPSLAANTKQQPWADQDHNNCSSIPQDNMPLNQNEAHVHVNGANLSAITPSLESSAILYQADHPVDPALWDSNFSSISLFGTVEVLGGDTKNIACSLQRIATFIKQRPLGERNSLDIP